MLSPGPFRIKASLLIRGRAKRDAFVFNASIGTADFSTPSDRLFQLYLTGLAS